MLFLRDRIVCDQVKGLIKEEKNGDDEIQWDRDEFNKEEYKVKLILKSDPEMK